VLAVVEAETVSRADVLPLACAACSDPLDLNRTAPGDCSKCPSCGWVVCTVRSARVVAPPPPPPGPVELTVGWINALWAFRATRAAFVAAPVAGVVQVCFSSVLVIALVLSIAQLVLLIVFAGCQAAALGTPDRATRRAVVAALAFSFGAPAAGALVAFFLDILFGLFVSLLFGSLGYAYWLVYFHRVGVALGDRGLCQTAHRCTSAFAVNVVLSSAALLLFFGSAPGMHGNLLGNLALFALTIWLLHGYLKLTREAERAIHSSARAGTLPT
jgi:hypothetical protein